MHDVATKIVRETPTVSAFSNARQRLETDGVVELQLDENPADDYRAVIDGMLLITEDTRLQEAFAWRTFKMDEYGRDYRQEVGLSLPEAHKKDKKFRFQYTPEMERTVPRDVMRIPEIENFLRALNNIDTRARRLIEELTRHLDAANDSATRPYKERLSPLFLFGQTLCITRVIRYPTRHDGEPDAIPHVDRDGFTPHWWASRRGLVIVTPDGRQIRVGETDPQSVAIFPGEKCSAITRGKFTLGTPHGVRRESSSTVSGDEDRYAIVSFVHPITRLCDAMWLLANRHLIQEYEASIAL